MTVPSKGVLTFIFLAIMAVASTPLASAQEAMEGLNIVPVEPPKPCPKFTTANIVVSAECACGGGFKGGVGAGIVRREVAWEEFVDLSSPFVNT